MNKVLILLFFLLNCFAAKAQDTVSVALNMDECISCYNTLRFLDDLNPDVGLKYIFAEAYQPDSAKIQKIFKFPARGRYVWSDSLNRTALINGYMSSIGLDNPNRAKPLKFSVKYELDKPLVAFFSKLVRPDDTFNFEEPVFSMTNAPLVYQGTDVYAIDTWLNTITKASLITGKSETIVQFSDSLLRLAFRNYFGSDSAWQATLNINKSRGDKRMATISEVSFAGNKMYVIAKHVYFEINDTETIESHFNSLFVFDRNCKLIRNIPIHYNNVIERKEFKGHLVADTLDFISVIPSFWVNPDRSVMLGVLLYEDDLTSHSQHYFLAKFTIDTIKNQLVFDKFFPYPLSERYQPYGYSFSNAHVSWDGTCFANYLDDVIYFTEDFSKKVDLNIFPKDAETKWTFSPKNYIAQVNMDSAYYYVYGGEGGDVKYYRIDRKTGARLEAKIELANIRGLGRYTAPGSLDYNYLLVPINAHQLERIKIFNN